ncbi:MAG TPA: hypothetical protein VKF41_02240 [Bryobacteraceae bacterium]|nr:hypothetical protein [Bryobacteraceae bacterium]
MEKPPEKLVVQAKAAAQAEGKTLRQVIHDKVAEYIEERQRQDLMARGQERGGASGRSEGDGPGGVKE